MQVIDWIVADENLERAVKVVQANKGAAGIDKMAVGELDEWFSKNKEKLKSQIREGSYKPSPVRRVYIPKPNGDKRPLGIPTLTDRVVQQATAQVLMLGYDKYFSEHSHGFRSNRSCHTAIKEALTYLNEDYVWVVDLDIEGFFDHMNHNVLISIIPKRINDAPTLRLLRAFLHSGVMEDGLVKPTETGASQGGPMSPVLSNIYLNELDRELESRGIRFVRYADDCVMFLHSKRAAERVMYSIGSWLERKLRLRVSATKTKVVRPTKAKFLGFTFWKSTKGWKCRPQDSRKKRLMERTREILCRRKAAARPLAQTFRQLNWLIRGWVNYFGIGSAKGFLDEYGQWLRHKVRVVIIKQWKRPKTIFKNLAKLNRIFSCNMSDEDLFKVANSRLGLYRQCAGHVVNFLLSPKALATPTKDRPGLIDPLQYYLERFERLAT